MLLAKKTTFTNVRLERERERETGFVIESVEHISSFYNLIFLMLMDFPCTRIDKLVDFSEYS